MNFPKKFYRWKDTSEFSVHYGKWDEWKPFNRGTTEEDILYWISKGRAYQICEIEIEIKNVIGYEAEETRARLNVVPELPELLEMLHKAIKVLERVGNDTLDGRNTVQDARSLINKIIRGMNEN